MRAPIHTLLLIATAAVGTYGPRRAAEASPPPHAKAHGYHQKHDRDRIQPDIHYHGNLRCGTDHSARAEFHRQRERAAQALSRASRHAGYSRSCDAAVGPQLSHLSRYARMLETEMAIERARERIPP